MPLSLSNRDQNSGHLFYNRRLRAATTRFSVRMKHDDRKQTAALALSMVLVAIAAGWMMLLNVLKPTGIVGDSAIIGDRDSGALYARIDGRLYPALNLTSARLATGTAGQPTWVKPAEIAKYPTGPLVGIPGAPAAMPVNRGAVSAWAVCDTAGRPRSADKPVVTSIAGPITGGGRATHLRDDAGLLVTFDGSTYVIWGGKRSQIDPTNRAVTLSLGLDPGVTSPIQISRALFDGLPATEPLRVPAVPEAGTPSTWVPGARVGSVLQAQTAGGGSQFYVLLPDGVQKISSFVADLLRSANSYGAAAPRVVTPDVLVHTPQVTSLPVEYYPAGRLNFVDTAADPTTCVSWEKASTDPQARVAVYNGRGLPVPPSMDSRIVRLVRDDRAPASVVATQVLVLPGAANFVTSTSGVIHRRVARIVVLGVRQWGAIRDRQRRGDAAGAGPGSGCGRAGAVAVAADFCCGTGSVAGCGTLGSRYCAHPRPGGHCDDNGEGGRLDVQESVSHQPRQHRPAETRSGGSESADSSAGARAAQHLGDDRRSRVDRGADRHHRHAVRVGRAQLGHGVLPADGHRRVQHAGVLRTIRSSPQDHLG